MLNERNVSSWLLKPCTDGISIDVRPPQRYQLNLLLLKDKLPDFYKSDFITPNLAILYNADSIKITLYQSGRMLLETRNMDLAEILTKEIIKFFNFANES